MPLTGTFQSIIQQGQIATDSYANDVVLRAVTPGSRVLVMAGSNVPSIASFGQDGIVARVPIFSCNDFFFNEINGINIDTSGVIQTQQLRASDANLTNVVCDSCSTPNLNISGNAFVQNLTSSITNFATCMIQTLYSKNNFSSNCSVTNLLESVDVRIDGYLYSSISNASPLKIGEPSKYLAISTRNTMGHPVLSSPSTNVITFDTSSVNFTNNVDVRGELRALSFTGSNIEVSGKCFLNGIVQIPKLCDSFGTPAMSFETPNSAVVMSSLLQTNNIDVTGILYTRNGLSSGEYSVSGVGSNLTVVRGTGQGFNISFGAVNDFNTRMVLTGNQAMGCMLTSHDVTTPLTLGVGYKNSISILSNSAVLVSSNLLMSKNSELSLGDFRILNSSVNKTLSVSQLVGSSNRHLLDIRLNEADRGGCVRFQNVDAGGRFIVWQDSNDINAYGGMGKEPQNVIMRTPPNMGISFVGGNGALGTEFGKFSSNGKLGVNTNVPTSRLQVNSMVDETTLKVENTYAQSTSTLIKCNREVNNGTNIPPSLEFHVNDVISGAISHPSVGSTIYGTASDRRLKNVTSYLSWTEGLDVISKLNPVKFHFKADTRTQPALHTGFIADEVQEWVPHAVVGESNDPSRYQTMDMSKLVPYLVSAVQYLTSKVRMLEAGKNI